MAVGEGHSAHPAPGGTQAPDSNFIREGLQTKQRE